MGCIDNLRNIHIRSVRNALAVFYMKMRLSISNRVLASLFHLTNEQAISQVIRLMREALVQDFTAHHIGLQHIDRQTVLNHHRTSMATKLFTTSPNFAS